jgi:hypothetical protein
MKGEPEPPYSRSLDRYTAVPNGPMRRARGRLILRSEERLDLVIGLVDGAGAPGFLFTLAAQLEGRFGERLLAVVGLRFERLGGFHSIVP